MDEIFMVPKSLNNGKFWLKLHVSSTIDKYS